MPRPPARNREDPGKERQEARSFHYRSYPVSRVAAALAERSISVSVCLPARECAGTIGEIVSALGSLRRAGVVDQIVVVDAASRDGTAALAARGGAAVWQEAELMRPWGPVLGKGDAMWRALSVLRGDLVCFLDADTEQFSPHFLTGLLGPLVCEPGVSFVKAFYRRPLASDGVLEADGGGRVNHLTARPALAVFYPQLAHVRQPLAGEVAARRDLLERLPFATGYGVEIAMLIDAWRQLGLQGIAEVDLGEHRNRHQPLSSLTPMAVTVLATMAARLEREGRLAEPPPGAAGGSDAADGAGAARGGGAEDGTGAADGAAAVDGASAADGGRGARARAPLERPPFIRSGEPVAGAAASGPAGAGVGGRADAPRGEM
jgi:glucosyl-3-phosphoglycerate synthase